MKKKLLIAFMAITAAICGAVAVTGCNKSNGGSSDNGKHTHKFHDEVCACGYHKPTDGLEYTDKGDYCEFSGRGTATETDIYIADEYNGKPVTSIGSWLFDYNNDIISITIPDGVTSICECAFA